MAILFERVNNVVMPTDETLLTPPFSKIWSRDTSKGRVQAMKEFAYIEFLCSQMKTNPYRDLPEESKELEINRAIFGGGYKPDSLVKQAIEKYNWFNEHNSISYRYYIAVKQAVEKMRQFFETFDMSQINPKTGNPVYKPRDITTALSDTEKLIGSLKTMERKVHEELYDELQVRAQKKISPFADPSSLK